MSVLMRRAKLSDLDAIMRLERETFTDDAWPEDAMRREIESPHGYYLVAVDEPITASDAADEPGPALRGYAGLLAPSGSEQGDIQTIAVDPSSRGMGLGRGLMHALITAARRRHVTELFLEVRADNPIARALYDSLGFEQIGVRPRYYRGGVDAVLMRLVVKPAVARPADASGAAGGAGAAASGASGTSREGTR
ncbi:ribosomal protein S18-alanine N-acetyltransferase [Agromyces sp. SYSU K20354]|uniref:ribosomal protein S18-alanine N-acetyltransferase n=1 Tax=Agromyces cavernae TaxID=2898659 RepID=UPI001E3A14E6|nr:ribosomal protein S18-alanine N-acetyltransferase [Agromyces cavernae]MCD2441694.1 ribosomal protein S18-alanine N-acetyltransferase [Agromyces cavernae]